MTRAGDDLLSSGEMRARTDLTLAAILRVLLVVLPILVAAALFVDTMRREIAFLSAALAFVLVLHVLHRRGHSVFCAHALVFGFIAMSIAGLATYGSIRAPASVALVAAITFGGIFLRRRTLFLAALLGIVALGCVVYAENAGWLPKPDYRVTVGHWVFYSGIIAAVALVLYYMRSLLFDLLQRLQDELAQRQKAETGLRQSEEHFSAAEEELRGNRRLLETVIDAIPMAIFAKDLDSNYIMLNKRMAEFFGVPKETLLRRHTSNLPVASAARSKSLKDDAWVFEHRHALIQPDQLLERPDGVHMRYHSTKLPLFDEAGKLIGLLGINRDIGEEKRAQEALRNSEKLLENIAKGVSSQTGAEFFRTLVLALGRELPAHMVFVAETVGRGRVRTIACCIDGALAGNFDYKLAGSPCILGMERRGSVVHPQGVAEQFPEDEGLARRGIVGYAGTSLFDVSGKAIGILVALTLKPIERKEFFVAMLEIFAARAAVEIERARSDATVRELNISLERRVRERTAELEAANRDLDSFGYSVSHDLRSPLGALNGFAHLLRTREAERLSPDGVHLLRQLETNATRMTNLIEGLLEFSRLGRKPVTRVAVPMAALVGEVVEELGVENRGRRLEFRVGALTDAYGDPMLLRQVWRNLIGNAVKYSRGRDPAQIEIGSDPATGEYFVRDNGTGFDMQYAERLFGVFERLHNESEFEGTGIGLAIVQRVVNRHGGMVRGEGRLDQGATFRFTLPAR